MNACICEWLLTKWFTTIQEFIIFYISKLVLLLIMLTGRGKILLRDTSHTSVPSTNLQGISSRRSPGNRPDSIAYKHKKEFFLLEKEVRIYRQLL